MGAPAAQFNFLDGGERAPGNPSYYAPLGLTGPASIGEYGTKSFFVFNSANQSTETWSPPGFSAPNSFWTIRCAFDVWGFGINIINATGATLANLVFNSNGSVSLHSGGTLLGTSPANLFFLNTVFQLSFKLTANATTGSFILYLNGNPTPITGVTISGINTSGGQTSLNSTGMQIPPIANANIFFYFRDLSCHDGTAAAPFNACLPNCGAELTPPNANVSTAFISSNGDPNYEVYATAPPGSAYCGSSTVGAVDQLAITPLPANALSVIGFKTFEYSSKSDTAARATQRSVISSGTTEAGAVNYLNDTPVLTEDVYTDDPATDAPITVGAYNVLILEEAVAA